MAIPSDLREVPRRILESHDRSLGYAIIVQPLIRLVDANRSALFLGAKDGWSARSFAKNVIVPFDSDLDGVLGGSGDPYVSNPLRADRGTDTISASTHSGSGWTDVISFLEFCDSDPAAAEAALLLVLDEVRRRVLDLNKLLAELISAQRGWRDGDPRAKALRKDLCKQRGPRFLASLTAEPWEADGGEGTPSGTAEIPWLRVFDPESSPKPTSGFYAVYLTAADGSGVYLSVNQGAEHLGAEQLRSRVDEGRRLLDLEVTEAMDLRSSQSSGRPAKYEDGSFCHWWYEADSLPPIKQLEADLDAALAYLERLSQLTDSSGDEGSLPKPELAASGEITLEQLAKAVEDRNLVVPIRVLERTLAALRSGKHLLFTGPPGTGKTTLAEAVCAAAVEVGVADGWILTTATADWTSVDTVGGYWMNRAKDLVFKPGLALESAQQRSWLVIDELNRADVDKAFGQLFTVLSGQAVSLPFETGDPAQPVSVVPHGANPPSETHAVNLPKGWRLIGTINTRDRDFLFRLSFALLRRFAVIDIPPPEPDVFADLVASLGDTGDETLNDAIRSLARLHHPDVANIYGKGCSMALLGPAIVLDLARYLREAAQISDRSRDELLEDGLVGFVIAQWEHLTPSEAADLARYLGTEYFVSTTPAAVAGMLEVNLGIQVAEVGDSDS